MKKFICVIIVATVLGGFVGGELMRITFSITGAVIGGVGLATVLLGLGAFFESQEKKKRSQELTPEMRGVFDRMFGKAPEQALRSAARSSTSPARAASNTTQEAETFYLDTVGELLALQLMPTYMRPEDAFAEIMTNMRAAGYIFGFHDSFLQSLSLVDPKNPEKGSKLIEQSYKLTFGEFAGFALYSMSLTLQEDSRFQNGRTEGGIELVEYLDKKVPPLGLGRILLLG